ncbi:MAG: hypothetical protein K6E13_07745 [Lachnospiraceae bacterium]|nr:hypothetical protein [Lachnospiraceae bacterium]
MADSNTWYKVDNVAKVFLATYNRRDTRSFRVSCTLNEKIDPEALQLALDMTVKERSQFEVKIHKGLFWHYLEVTDKRPMIELESDRPCPTLYGPEVEGQLHYKVTYWNNRINLDMFHALTDGNGGMEFLNIIVQNYLKQKHPGELEHISMHSGASQNSLNEDSFKKFYDRKAKNDPKLPKGYKVHGLKLGYDQLQFFEVHMPAKSVLELAKKDGVSLTSYLGARLMMALYADMPALQRKKPITISMPVNLRNYYPSQTIRNFFNSVYVSHVFDGTEEFKELAKEFDEKLKEELTPERIALKMNSYEKLEDLFFIRMVPLFIKNPVVAAFSKRESKSVSAIISNLGRIQVPDEILPYIEGYTNYCSSRDLFITVSSFKDELVFGVTSPYRNTNVLRSFVKGFSDSGIDVTLYATETV